MLKMRENFPRKFPENSRKIPEKSGGIFVIKYNDTELKSLFLLVQKCGKFRNISRKFQGKFPKCQKFSEELSPENFPEISVIFFVEMQRYRA